MEKCRSDPDYDYCPRARHACWAMPGTVTLILMMILAFGAQFDIPPKQNGTPADAVVPSGSVEPAVAARTAIAAKP